MVKKSSILDRNKEDWLPGKTFSYRLTKLQLEVTLEFILQGCWMLTSKLNIYWLKKSWKSLRKSGEGQPFQSNLTKTI